MSHEYARVSSPIGDGFIIRLYIRLFGVSTTFNDMRLDIDYIVFLRSAIPICWFVFFAFYRTKKTTIILSDFGFVPCIINNAVGNHVPQRPEKALQCFSNRLGCVDIFGLELVQKNIAWRRIFHAYLQYTRYYAYHAAASTRNTPSSNS